MNEIIEYRIVSSSMLDLLNDGINKGIGLGWQPYGNPMVEEGHFAQAVVKYKTKKK